MGGFHRFVTAMPYLVRITAHAQKWMELNPSNVFHHECRNYLKLYYHIGTYRILVEFLLISSLPGKASRIFVDIAMLAEQFNKCYQR